MIDKIKIINASIVIFCFVLYMLFFWNVSGGDLALLLTFGLSVLIQSIIIVIVFYRHRKSLLKAFIGIGISPLICFVILKLIEYKKEKIKPSVETVIGG